MLLVFGISQPTSEDITWCVSTNDALEKISEKVACREWVSCNSQGGAIGNLREAK